LVNVRTCGVREKFILILIPIERTQDTQLIN